MKARVSIFMLDAACFSPREYCAPKLRVGFWDGVCLIIQIFPSALNKVDNLRMVEELPKTHMISSLYAGNDCRYVVGEGPRKDRDKLGEEGEATLPRLDALVLNKKCTSSVFLPYSVFCNKPTFKRR